jgi:hypothetical protein
MGFLNLFNLQSKTPIVTTILPDIDKQEILSSIVIYPDEMVVLFFAIRE